MKKLTYIVVIVSYTVLLQAQDFHFSQFNENPSLVNPALTGSQHSMRASLVYKNQWKTVTTPYKTYGFSFETKFKPNNWESVDPRTSMTFKRSYSKMAGGISVYSDNAGDANMKTFQTNGTLAMLFPLSKHSALSLGLQGSMTQRKIGNSNLVYPNQYNGTNYDPNMTSGEGKYSQTLIYPEFAAGFAWMYGHTEKSMTANNQVKTAIGFSTYHINRPQQNFAHNAVKQYRKYVFHGVVTIGIPNTLTAIEPSWLVQVQGPNKEIILGTKIKYFLGDESKYTGIHKRNSVGLGVYYRNYDALVFSVSYDGPMYSIGINYDSNISSLAVASHSVGGIEINLKFFTPNAYLYQKRQR